MTYLDEEHQLARCDEDVWCLGEHQALELLPLDRRLLAAWIQRIVRLLLQQGLERELDLVLGLWLAFLLLGRLHDDVDAHVLEHVCIDEAYRDVVDGKSGWVGHESGLRLLEVVTLELLGHWRLWQRIDVADLISGGNDDNLRFWVFAHLLLDQDHDLSQQVVVGQELQLA